MVYFKCINAYKLETTTQSSYQHLQESSDIFVDAWTISH